MPTDFPFSHRLEVRFRDCDAFGHVNHAVYFTYLEQCRYALWRHLSGSAGLPGIGTIIAHAECDYRAPAYVDDALDVRVKAGDVGRSSFTLRYEIVNATTGQCLANAMTVMVAFDYAAKKAMPIPAEARSLLAKIGGAA
jgi:acyl-CoA thioester hydrolase